MTVRYFLRTFGCRVNQAESAELEERLSGAGGRRAPSLAEADTCVVNACTVTRDADRQALKFLRKVRRENPSARLIVTGCLASRSPEAIRAADAQAVIAGPQELVRILGLGAAPRPGLGDRSRALLKIQDGCDAACAYCIVPKVRPHLRSVPAGEVESRLRELIAAGLPEIVLCGIRLGRYEAEGLDLCGLLERLIRLPGDFRLRLSSLEIGEADDRLAGLLGEKLCPHLHLPLQSGCEATLRRMNRPYKAASFAGRLESLRRKRPGLAIFTDIITGFPGETDAEFRESLDFVRGLGLRGLHVFPYSRREGTAAALMPGQLPPAEVRRRLDDWRELDEELRSRHAREAIGQGRVAVPLRTRQEAVTEDFLTVRLDRGVEAGLWRVQVSGPLRAIVENRYNL